MTRPRSTPQFTQGPWRIKQNRVTLAVLDATGNYVTENIRHLQNQEANARLIAAAPDLYEALQACSFQLAQLVAAHGDFSDVNAKALDAARAALQRAEQESGDEVK